MSGEALDCGFLSFPQELQDELTAMSRPRTRKQDALDLMVDADRIDNCVAATNRHRTPNGDLWLETFADEIDLVQRARNNLVFGKPLSSHNLMAAVDLADKLCKAAIVANLMSPR